MKQRGIGIGVHYQSKHLFTIYRTLGFKQGDIPQAERDGRQTITLPLFPAMHGADVERVCDSLGDVLKSNL
ncbi:MAG: DegT/DnrJ/EryC1/StrS family aminotransferase, partial [Proteobacteria bacterium]|nr:DegT/DnrJ/EryC1/StrS family aminotransferase [Pseudomonadota bacterium]